MKRPAVRTALILAPFLLLNAAGWIWLRAGLGGPSRGEVMVAMVSPVGNADRAERLRITLDRPIGREEEGAPTAADLFTISPAPLGVWRFDAPDVVEFVLAEPLPPGRVYRVAPAEDFEERSGFEWGDEDEIVFRTRALALESAGIGRTSHDSLELSLIFNQPVLPRDLGDRIEVRDARGTRLDFEVTTREPASTILFKVHRPESTWPTAEATAGPPWPMEEATGARWIRFEIASDLLGHGGERPLAQKVARTVQIPRGFAVAGVTFMGFSDRRPHPDRAAAEIRFTADADRSRPPPALVVEPEPADLELNWGYGNRLRATASFQSGVRYRFTVPAGLLAADGRALEKPETVDLTVPERRPSIHLPFDRGCLSTAGSRLLEVDVVNVNDLELRAHRIHQNNLAAFLQGHDHDATGREYQTRRFPLDLVKDRTETVVLDLAGLFPEGAGVYAIRLRSPQGYWTRDDATLLVSDLGLTVKRGREGLLVWTTSLTGGGPAEGVRVAARSFNNQLQAEATTGADGVAVLSVPDNHPDGAPWLVTAKRDEDESFLILNEGAPLLDGTDLSGRAPPHPYDLFLYTERGVYRPGDTIHLTGILRWAEGGTPPEIPLALDIIRPDGLLVAEQTAQPGAEGLFHADFAVPEDGQTGPWKFRVKIPGGKKAISEITALVEAFVAARIEVKASPVTSPTEPPEFEVEAKYLFGRPAAGLSLACAWRFAPEDFRSLSRPGYSFDTGRVDAPEPGGAKDITLDEAGRARVAVDDLPAPDAGRYGLEFTATVTEPGSRSVSSTVRSVLDRTPRHIGLGGPESGWIQVGAPLGVPFVLLTPDDQLARPAPLTFELFRIEYGYEHLEVDGRWTWRSIERPIEMASGKLAPPGPEGEIEIVAPQGGEYRLVVKDIETGQSTRLRFHAASSQMEARSFALRSAERLEIYPKSDPCRPGETVEVLIRCPFKGLLLLTLESDEVIWRTVVPMDSAEAVVEVPVPESLRGGAFLVASVVRPVDPDSDDWRPHRAVGAARLRTHHGDRRIEVSIDAPAQAEPGGAVTVAVKAQGAAGGLVHLFAVDEGILTLTDQKTPDPHGHFFAERRLAVESSDLFADLIPDLERPGEFKRIGGGAAARERAALRRNPVPATRREAAVIFREAIQLDEDGRAALDITLLELTGALRFMAVSVSGDHYGSAELRMEISRPVDVLAGWPRFLAPGDRAAVAVTVFNRTELPRRVSLQLALTGPLVSAEPLPEMDVAAGESETVFLPIDATGVGVGEAELRISTDGGYSGRSAASISVRPATAIVSRTEVLSLRAGERMPLPAPEGFAGGVIRTLTVCERPELSLRPAMDGLLAYPYGCVEQTSSQILAIMMAPALLRAEGDGRERIARDMVQSGLARLVTMQTRDGGVAYWPGGPHTNPWATAYVGALLVTARDAGYEIPTRLSRGVLDYLEKRLAARGDLEPGDDERALVVRVLASFDRPPMGWLARLSERAEGLDMAGRAHLASAWLAVGRRDKAASLITEDLLSRASAPTTRGRLTSPVRQQAVLLATLLSLDPGHPWLPLLADRLLAARRGGAWHSTLEDGSALSALARYQLSRPAEPTGPVSVEVRCGADRLVLSGKDAIETLLPARDDPILLIATGEGTATLLVRTEGLAAEKTKPSDRGLLIRRSWTDAEGNPVDPARMKIGDLVRVEVTLAAPGVAPDAAIGNVAVVDLLPGCMEVENPRLSTSAGRSATRLAAADRVEFQDDRVVVFGTADQNVGRFVYFLRVTASGKFVSPPIEASCMYRPEISSVWGGGECEVSR